MSKPRGRKPKQPETKDQQQYLNWSRDFNRSLLLFLLYASPPHSAHHTHKNNHSHIPVQTIGHYFPEPHFSPPSELLHSLHEGRQRRYLWAHSSLAVDSRTVASFSIHIRGFLLSMVVSCAQVKKSLCQDVAQYEIISSALSTPHSSQTYQGGP